MKKIELEISDELFQELEKARTQSGLHSLNDFLLVVLQEYVDSLNGKTDTEIDAETEIRKRLENLGYL